MLLLENAKNINLVVSTAAIMVVLEPPMATSTRFLMASSSMSEVATICKLSAWYATSPEKKRKTVIIRSVNLKVVFNFIFSASDRQH